jgi:hypothetical protein
MNPDQVFIVWSFAAIGVAALGVIVTGAICLICD